MYDKEIEKILKKEKIGVGDRIVIFKAGGKYEGLLMPRIELGDQNSVVIKLDNGYNVGLRYDRSMKIKKSGGEIKKEVLGKRKGITKLKFDPKKPPVSLISTGGTISSRVDYKTGGVFMLMEPGEILTTTPELAGIINLRSILSPFRIASEDMTAKEWQKIARLAAKELNSGMEGVIVTHGTDTLHFTSAALSFMLRDLYKPVALVGAQRSPDRGSSDGPMNLICASHYAISDIGEVAIVMHGSANDDYCLINRGCKVRKMHTSRRDAFRPVNALPVGKVYPEGKIDIIDRNYRKRKNTEVVADTKFEEKVAIVTAYPGAEPGIIDHYVDKGYKGIILASTALGHVPGYSKNSWLPSIQRAIDEGVVVGNASQTLYGRVHPHVYRLLIDLHARGVIFLEDMLPEVAYIKLGWVLGHTGNKEEVRKMMLTNYAGEISERILPETFLY